MINHASSRDPESIMSRHLVCGFGQQRREAHLDSLHGEAGGVFVEQEKCVTVQVAVDHSIAEPAPALSQLKLNSCAPHTERAAALIPP